MSVEENKTVIRRAVEALNKRDLRLLDELMAPDYVDHTHRLQSLANFKQLFTTLITGFPDFRFAIEDMIAEGDRVWVRIIEWGTHTGEYLGLAPTGQKVTAKAVHNFHIVKGKIAEDYSVSDDLAFYKQLGVIEYTEKGKKLFPESAK